MLIRRGKRKSCTGAIYDFKSGVKYAQLKVKTEYKKRGELHGCKS